MMSTFSGLILGVVSAAVLTVFYGEEFGERLRSLALTRPPVVAPAAAGAKHELGAQASAVAASAAGTGPQALQGTALAQPRDALGAAAATQPVQPLPVDPGAVLQRRWAEYLASAADLPPAGEFPYRACFQRAAAAHGLPESLLLAVASGESDFDLAARSPSDAVGLMQIQWPQTSRHLGILREADLYDPCTNVDAGARYLAELGQRYGGDLHRTLGAYNYGPSRIGAGALPDGAIWYSQYIYQRLQQVLGRPHVASSELVQERPQSGAGYHVLMSFNRPYRARAFLQHVRQLLPSDLELAQRSEQLGRYEVVLLYDSAEERARGLRYVQATELVALAGGDAATNSF